MSKAQELVDQIDRLLQKHEVHNPILAHEIAIMIIKREKTEMNRTYRRVGHLLNKTLKGTEHETGS